MARKRKSKGKGAAVNANKSEDKPMMVGVKVSGPGGDGLNIEDLEGLVPPSDHEDEVPTGEPVDVTADEEAEEFWGGENKPADLILNIAIGTLSAGIFLGVTVMLFAVVYNRLTVGRVSLLPPPPTAFNSTLIREKVEYNEAVARIQWEIDAMRVDEIVKRRRPVVLTDTEVDVWRASKWTPDTFKASGVTLPYEMYSMDTLFTEYHSERPMAALPGAHWTRFPTSVARDVNGSQFILDAFETEMTTGLRYARGMPDTHFVLFDDDVSSLGEGLDVEFGPVRELVVDADAPLRRSVRMATPGVETQVSYSGLHSFETPVYGKTRYILFGPKDLTGLYLFPNLHPCTRQSQIPFRSDNVSSRFEGVDSLTPFEVVLEKGEVLYIPPYWAVATASFEPSITLSVQQVSREAVELSMVEGLRFRGGSVPLVAWHAAIESLIATVVGPQINPHGWVETYVYKPRYEPLLTAWPGFLNLSSSFCPGLEPWEPEGAHRELAADIDSVADGLNRVLAKFPAAVRPVLLANYIEDIALWGSGGRVEFATTFLNDYVTLCE